MNVEQYRELAEVLASRATPEQLRSPRGVAIADLFTYDEASDIFGLCELPEARGPVAAPARIAAAIAPGVLEAGLGLAVASLVWLFTGLHHLTLYAAASCALWLGAVRLVGRDVAVARAFAILAMFASLDCLSYLRFRGHEGRQALGAIGVDIAHARFPWSLVIVDLIAYGLLLAFLCTASQNISTNPRARRASMRVIGAFGLCAAAYWSLILVGVQFGWRHFEVVRALVEGVWHGDVLTWAVLVWLLYGLVALVAFLLPTWDSNGYPRLVTRFVPGTADGRVSMNHLVVLLAAAPLSYAISGPWIAPHVPGDLVIRALVVAVIVVLALWHVPRRRRS